MEILLNPNIQFIVSVISLVLAIFGIYLGCKNHEKKSVLFLHFENYQILDRNLLHQTDLISSNDNRLSNNDIYKLNIYFSNNGNRVIENSDWSHNFKIMFENNEIEIHRIKFYSTNPNVITSNVFYESNEISFNIGEFEPDDIFKIEIEYLSREAQKGKYEFKLKGYVKESGEILSNSRMVELIAENKYYKTHMLGTYPAIIVIFYFCIYYLFLISFNLKTSDIVAIFQSKSILDIVVLLIIFLILILITLPIIAKIHSLFIPFYRKIQSIDNFCEIESRT